MAEPTSPSAAHLSSVLTYRKGQFSQAEKDALKQHFTQFKHVSLVSWPAAYLTLPQMNRLDDEDLVGMVMAKGTTTDRKDFGQFWPDAGELRLLQYMGDEAALTARQLSLFRGVQSNRSRTTSSES